MIRSITRPKPAEEVDRLLDDAGRVFVIGCGTCTTLTKTGGLEEVAAEVKRLTEAGRLVTGSVVLPVACDELTAEALAEHGDAINMADAVLVMSCAFGVQTVARQLVKTVVPFQDTLFIGKEKGRLLFDEICQQCGDCILGETGGVCPVVSCHKGLVNGPCGGTNAGKCEIDADKDCAWTLIYERLEKLGKLDLMRRLQPPRNHQVEPRPGKIRLSA
ncbi:MAG: methylenetetrahydrofolate reductase C-terminal domain-containing protein [Proteobacteria bacterium]|nr:methylenetetrahydrofolate reductase C-terminal domain-containing protein [Pseudomonadota bacterium]